MTNDPAQFTKHLPEPVARQFRTALMQWTRAGFQEPWQIRQALQIIQLVHASAGPTAKGMEKWAMAQKHLLDAQWRMLTAAQSGDTETTAAVTLLKGDLTTLLNILETTLTKDQYNAILTDWRARRLTETNTPPDGQAQHILPE